MRTTDIKKVLSIMFRYAIIQIGFWFIFTYSLINEKGIQWLFSISIFGPITLCILAPYIACKSVERHTFIGYACSRNGVFIAHIGFGANLSLLLLEVNNWIAHFTCIAIIFIGGITISRRLLNQHHRIANPVREGS